MFLIVVLKITKYMETHTLPYVKWIGSRNLLHDSGSWRWDGLGGGRENQEGVCLCTYRYTDVYLWLIHVDVWQKPTQYCKAIILQLKKIKF